jgi:hypothetical protein
MEEKIREVFKDYEVTHGGLVLVAKEIAYTMREFMEWALQFCEYDISDNTFLIMTETHVWDETSIDLAFDYWYKNVYKK